MKNPDNTAHAVLGIIVTSLSIVNPIMGILRPGVDAPKRKYFNFFHYLVGYSAQILAFAALYLGLEMFGLAGKFFIPHKLCSITYNFYRPSGKKNIDNILSDWSKSLLISIAVVWFVIMVVTRFTKSPPIIGKILAILFFLVFIGGFAAILSQLALAR